MLIFNPSFSLNNFQLHIAFHPEESNPFLLNIEAGQYHLLSCKNPELTSQFFRWLEGKYYNPENKLEYIENGNRWSDLLLLKKHLALVRFRLNENESSQFYYQQRYHATENDDVIKVAEYLGEISNPVERELMEKFCLQSTLHESINMLSTGEFRKIFLLKHAFSIAEILIIEEPFAGIDTESRKMLDELFQHLCSMGRSVLVISSETDKNFNANYIHEIGRHAQQAEFNVDFDIPNLNYLLKDEEIFYLKNIVASYNEHLVLDHINWQIRKNEKWKLSGKNGAGKSTLLSFIYADNPQVYSNEVYLFGRKRGTGESIWDIKDLIGFYSSEFHRYFDKSRTVEDAIRSIVFQNPYKKKVLSEEENNFLQALLQCFKLENKLEKTLYEISVVEQKITLLIGVLLKNAPILILDEPFQAFDEENIMKAKKIVEKYIADRTFIMVSHLPDEIPECVNKHFHLDKGNGTIIC